MAFSLAAAGLWCLLAGGGTLRITPIDTAAAAFPTATDYLRILERFPLYAERGFHTPHRGEAQLGWFGDGRNDENGQRTLANFILAYAYLATSDGYNESVSGVPRETVREHCLQAIRYWLRTHVTGDLPCTNDAPWGNHWQSAWWTSKAVGGIQLVREWLTPDELAAVERVVTHEADRHTGLPPRVNEYGDTKSEENAWDAEVVAWAINLYPGHPHRADWESALAVLCLNTLSVADDLTSTRRVQGRPLRDWLGSSPCIHSDFTIENHGFFHICYMVCPLHSLAWCDYAFRLHGNPVPEVVYHHVRDVWERTKQFALWEDRFAYAGGKDWPRYAYGMYFMLPALVQYQQLWGDGEARRIEQQRVARFEQEQRQWADGSFFSGRWTALRMERWPAEWETDAAANLTIAALIHRLGPDLAATPAAEFHRAREGTFISRESELAVRRDPRRFASWCWKSNGGPVTGLVCSHRGEHMLEWNHSLAGAVRLNEVRAATSVVSHAFDEFAGGFATVGTVQHGLVDLGPSPYRLVVQDNNIPCAEILSPNHPLFAGPERIESLAGLVDLDSISAVGPGWTVLATNREGGPSLLEATPGEGRFILSMTNFEERSLAGDPIATALRTNLLAYVGAGTARCGYVAGEAHLRAALDDAGVDCEPIANLATADLDAFDVIFLDRTATRARPHYAKLLRWVAAGGTVVHGIIQDTDWAPDMIGPESPAAVHQQLAFCALPDGRTSLILGRWLANHNVSLAELDLLDFRLANDIFNGETRSLWYGRVGGEQQLESLVGPRGVRRTVELPGDWLNVDSDLTLVALGDAATFGATDDPARRAPHGSLRYAQLHLRPRLRPAYARGEIIARYGLVIRTDTTPTESAALAAALADTPVRHQGPHAWVTIPGADGRRYTFRATFGDQPRSLLETDGDPDASPTLPRDRREQRGER